jgi:hypothetical protein
MKEERVPAIPAVPKFRAVTIQRGSQVTPAQSHGSTVQLHELKLAGGRLILLLNPSLILHKAVLCTGDDIHIVGANGGNAVVGRAVVGREVVGKAVFGFNVVGTLDGDEGFRLEGKALVGFEGPVVGTKLREGAVGAFEGF